MRWLKAQCLRVVFGILIAALTTPGWAAAQTTTGTITGKITDSQGLPLPGVTVTVSGPNLQGVLTVATAENGDYIVPRVPPGSYTVAYELSGFERQQKSVDVATTASVTLNATLGPAALTETVNVRA